MKLDRSYNGDFGLLPVEIWEMIYEIKTRLEWEWEQIKKKTNADLFNPFYVELRREFSKEDRLLYELKHHLTNEIYDLRHSAEIENRILSSVENNFEILPLEEYIFMNDDERETYNFRKFYHNILEKNNSTANNPFRYSNILCYLNDDKRQIVEEQIWDVEEQIRLFQTALEHGVITKSQIIEMIKNY